MHFILSTIGLGAILIPSVLAAPTTTTASWLGGTQSFNIQQRNTATDYAGFATSAIGHLNTYYDEKTGIWSNAWWNSANVVTMLADFQEYFPDAVSGLTTTVFPFALARAPEAFGFKGFLNNFYDDELWWALAFIKIFSITGQQQYLDQASAIFEDVKAQWGTAACGGGWWDKEHTQVNAIANALYMTTAAKLANIKPTIPREHYYLTEAVRSYEWIMASGMLNGQSLFNDGLNLTTCKNNNGPVFTYNQGVILSGLVEMTWSTGDTKYATLANTIASAAIDTLINDKGILVDPCEPSSCNGDTQQFKGIFARNIQFMYQRSTVMPDEMKTKIKSFLTKNADSIWAYDNNNGSLGLVWSGAEGIATVMTQSSALDALVGAAAVSLT